jgi:hypothetical protein
MKIPTIPYLSIPDKPLVSTTQEHLPIADITNDIVVYKDGGAALVMESTSLNFGLLSEKEQQAVIAAYAAMINHFSQISWPNIKILLWNLSKRKMFWESAFLLFFTSPHSSLVLENRSPQLPDGGELFPFLKATLSKKPKLLFTPDATI